MEYVLPPAETRAAILRSKNGRYQGADKEFHIFKAMRAKFGKEFVDWRQNAGEVEFDATPEGGFVMRDKPAEGIEPDEVALPSPTPTSTLAEEAADEDEGLPLVTG